MIEGQLEPLFDCERSLRIILHNAVQAQRRHNEKVAKYQAEHPEHDPACGILTRDACYLAGVQPRLARAGITLQDIQDLADGREPASLRAARAEPLHLPPEGAERVGAGTPPQPEQSTQ